METRRRWEWGAGAACLLLATTAAGGLLCWQLRQRTLNRELAQALTRRDVARAVSLVNQGADIRTRNANGATVLMVATKPGGEELFQLGLDRRLDVRAAENNGHSVLLYATVNRNEAAVRKLLARGVDPDQATNRGAAPLTWAARSGETGIVEALLEAGAEPNARLVSDGSTPLIRAAEKGHDQVVRLLLRHGADPNARDREGLSALDRARLQRQAATCRILARIGTTAVTTQ